MGSDTGLGNVIMDSGELTGGLSAAELAGEVLSDAGDVVEEDDDVVLKLEQLAAGRRPARLQPWPPACTF